MAFFQIGDGTDVAAQWLTTGSIFAAFSSAAATESAMLATWSTMGDHFTAGANGTQYLQDLQSYISDQESLLTMLESMASAAGGEPAWVSSEISFLEGSVSGNIGLVYTDGGTISGLTESSALSLIPGNSVAPNAALPGNASPSGSIVADIATLHANEWGPGGTTNSALDLATLSNIVQLDGSSSILGADAQAALQLILVGVDPSRALAQLYADYSNPSVSSNTSSLNGYSAQDRANAIVADSEFAAGSTTALDATLSNLAASSNHAIAQTASMILSYDGGGDTSGGLTLLLDLTQGVPVPSSLPASLSITPYWT